MKSSKSPSEFSCEWKQSKVEEKKKKAVLFQNKARHNIKWLKDVRVEDTKK